jgi:hypothetical protein
MENRNLKNEVLVVEEIQTQMGNSISWQPSLKPAETLFSALITNALKWRLVLKVYLKKI